MSGFGENQRQYEVVNPHLQNVLDTQNYMVINVTVTKPHFFKKAGTISWKQIQ